MTELLLGAITLLLLEQRLYRDRRAIVYWRNRVWKWVRRK